MTLSTLKKQTDQYKHLRQSTVGESLFPKPSVLCFSFLLGILILQSSEYAVAEEQRTWTSADGKNTIVAEMTRLDGNTLYLHQSASGKSFKVDLSQMSAADAQYAREQAKLMLAEDSKTTGPQKKERLWTSADGTQQLKAEFVAVKGDNIQLKAAIGVFTLPLSKFSKADLDYIQQTTAASSPGETVSAFPPSSATVEPTNTTSGKELSPEEVARLTEQLEVLNRKAGKLNSEMYRRRGGIEEVEAILNQAAPIAEQLRAPAEEDVSVASKVYAYESLVKNLASAKERVKMQGGAGIPIPNRMTRTTPQNPASSQNEPDSAQLNKDAGNTEFSKYTKPDHQTLLKMYYAANGDILNEDPSFAMEVYTTLALPPLDPQKDGIHAKRGFDRQWWDDSQEYFQNEFARRNIDKRVQDAASKQLADADNWKPTAVFRLRWSVRLGEYDFAAQKFPLPVTTLRGLNYSTNGFAKDKIPVERAYLSPSARKEYGTQKTVAPIFRMNFRPSQLLPLDMGSNGRSAVFTLAVTHLDKLDHLPMSPAQAESLLKQLSTRPGGRSKEREVLIEGLVQVGPITIAEGKLQEIPSNLIAARVLHPLTQQELHLFKIEPVAEPDSITKATTSANEQAGERVPDMARMRMALLQFGEHPQLLNRERLEEWTRNQIVTEQKIWKQLDEIAQEFKLQQAGRSTAMNLNPKQPIFVYSYRELQSQRQDLANGPLMEIFSGNDQAWSFIRKETNWDDRFNATVAPFLFSKEQVVDQSVESAKVALTPMIEAFAKQVADKVPDRLAIPVSLSRVTLNSARTALVVDPSYSSSQSEDGKFKLLEPVYEPTFGEPKQKPGVGFPQSVQNKMLYRVRSFPENLKADQMIDDWLFSGNAGHGMNRAVRSIQSGAKFLTDYPAAVALDREIVFDQIPLSPEIVNTLTEADYLRKHSGARAFEARIIVSEITIDLATEFFYDGKKQPKGVIVGKVDGIRILNRDGEPVAFIPASVLPASKVNPDDNPFTPEPGESFPKSSRTSSQDLTPAMIPLLIARHQSSFFESHLDQFIVTRLQHEHWFRTDPKKNTYGVDPAMGEALPVFENMPDEDGRKKLVTQFKRWVEKNKSIAAGPLTIRFGKLEFRHPILGITPAPAVIGGVYETPFNSDTNFVHSAMTAYDQAERDLKSASDYAKTTPAFAKRKENVAAWKKMVTNLPREIYFSTKRFEYIVPDSTGKRSGPTQGASMGGRSSGGIAGLPIAKPATEPIFPVLSIDKEIWLPEDASVAANNAPLQLELTFTPQKVEVLDQPAPHPWIEACLQHAPPQNIRSEMKEYRKRSDAGQYAMIHVNLQSARLVNADSGETILSLEIRELQKK